MARPTCLRRLLAALCLLAVQPVQALYFFDYNSSVDLEVNSNLLLIPENEAVSSGYRFSSAQVLGFESETRAWSISPNFMFQRFENDPGNFADQEFFNLNADGRYDWTDRFSTSLNVLFQLDNNIQLPDPTVLFVQRPIQRQSRNVIGRATYRFTDRLSASLNGTYLDNLFEDVPGLLVSQTSFDYQDVTAGGNYIWNERLSFNASVGLSRFKDFGGNTRNNDRFFNVGATVALSERWTFAGQAGLRQTEQTFRALRAGPVQAGPVVLLNGQLFDLNPNVFPDGTVDQVLDAIFQVPIVVVGGLPRLRIQIPISTFETRETVSNTYDFRLTRTAERSTASVALIRMIRPAGIQAQTDMQAMMADFNYQLSDRLSGAVNFNETTEVIQGQEFADQGRSARVFSANLNYALTRQFNLTASYRFFQIFGEALGLGIGNADGHAVIMSISYNGDRLEW